MKLLILRNWCCQHKQTSQILFPAVCVALFSTHWSLFKSMPPRLPTQSFSSFLITLNCCVRQASGFQSRNLSIYRYKFPRQKSLASGLRNFIDKVTIFKFKRREYINLFWNITAFLSFHNSMCRYSQKSLPGTRCKHRCNSSWNKENLFCSAYNPWSFSLILLTNS